jgi:membrane protease YdiL (CAAX protease family)
MVDQIVQNFNALLPSIVGSCIALVAVWLMFRRTNAAGNKKAAAGILIVFLGPIREELVFRLPVLLLAGVFATNTYVILITSVLFGLIHFKHSPFTNEYNMKRLEEKYPQFDLGPKFQFRARSATVVVTGLIGALFAVIALKTNSIVVPILCHVLWNAVIGPILVPICITFVYVGAIWIYEQFSRA